MAIGRTRGLRVVAVLASTLGLAVAGCGGGGESLTVGGIEYELLEAEEQFPGVVVRVKATTSGGESAVDVVQSIQLVDGKGEIHAAQGSYGVTLTLSRGGGEEGSEYEYELTYEVPDEAVPGSMLRIERAGATGEIDLGLS